MNSRLQHLTLLGMLCATACLVPLSFASTTSPGSPAVSVAATETYQVIEFRRYTIKPGKREEFATYFESYFPEAFQQLGALALGQGFERDHINGFTWLRGFHSMDARAIANSTFYYGPVWKEHRSTLNALIDDSDNVYLMRPLSGANGVAALPAVDPVTELPGAQGVWVAQLFAVQPDRVEEFAHRAEQSFARYREMGIRQYAVLVTLDARNNFPQLPVRTDGSYLLWLGVASNRAAVDSWQALADEEDRRWQQETMLTHATEQIVITPTRRSRLRWQ